MYIVGTLLLNVRLLKSQNFYFYFHIKLSTDSTALLCHVCLLSLRFFMEWIYQGILFNLGLSLHILYLICEDKRNTQLTFFRTLNLKIDMKWNRLVHHFEKYFDNELETELNETNHELALHDCSHDLISHICLFYMIVEII